MSSMYPIVLYVFTKKNNHEQWTDLHDPANVSMSDLLVGLTAFDHQTNFDVLLHIAGILINTGEVISSLECLAI